MVQYTGLTGYVYEAGNEIGRGGEGTVYQIVNRPDWVVKIYNDNSETTIYKKLKAMLSLSVPDIHKYAAFPTDIVANEAGELVGFTMKKLQGFLPLHKAFSPLDRKKIFPNKGYNFLLHVARNLAIAFHAIHHAGIVVGDVNEGNILVDSNGIVNFIDCDSFQIKHQSEIYYCEVGIPRYTPPELLQLGSFENVERTTNTDHFSMAVLLFQLLFLGRHPFAGRNHTKIDLDEEQAIRKNAFAYTIRNKKSLLQPPLNSLDINVLNTDIVQMFHQAFETQTRPAAKDWINALDKQQLALVTCSKHRIHIYPTKAKQCIWCNFKEETGVEYFLDESYLLAHRDIADIDNFINGFDIQKLELKPFDKFAPVPPLAPEPLDNRFLVYKNTIRIANIVALIVCVCGAIYFQDILYFLILSLYAIVFNIIIVRLFTDKKISLLTNELDAQNDKIKKAIGAYNKPTEKYTYHQEFKQLQTAINEYREYPNLLKEQRGKVVEKYYNEQLDSFLSNFSLNDAIIPSIGPKTKISLQIHGINTAKDINKINNKKVPGVGPKVNQILIDWQNQLITRFVYIPNTHLLNQEIDALKTTIEAEKAKKQDQIMKLHTNLNITINNIKSRCAVIEKDINRLNFHKRQLEENIKSYNNYKSLWNFVFK